MASIQRRNGPKGSRYRVQVRLKGQTQSATFASRADARAWASRVESDILQRQAGADAGGITLGVIIERYRREILPRKKARTQVNQAMHLAWWAEQLGSRALADVTPTRLAACRDRLAGSRSAGTVNQYLRSLSHVLSVASREWDWLEANPMRRVQALTEPRGRVRFLSDDERQRLLAACEASPNRMLHPVVMLALATGARKMELLGLTWPQVDLGRELITLEDTKNREPRSVPLTGQALAVMREHAKVVRIDTALVFPRADGQRPMDIRHAWYAALKRAAIEDFRFHDLRHSTASYLAMNGASLVEIADVLGHKTLSMVKRYAHLSEGHTRSVLDRMTKAIFE